MPSKRPRDADGRSESNSVTSILRLNGGFALQKPAIRRQRQERLQRVRKTQTLEQLRCVLQSRGLAPRRCEFGCFLRNRGAYERVVDRLAAIDAHVVFAPLPDL